MLHFFILSLLTFCYAETLFRAPHHTVNLDLPAKQRWSFLTNYRADAKAAKKYFERYISGFAATVVQFVAKNLEAIYGGELADEMRGAAKALEIDDGLLVMLNLLYELRGFNNTRPNETGGHTPPHTTFQPKGICTSIVAETSNGDIFHGRNLDWNLPSKIRAMTFHCSFVRKGKVIAEGGCFAGFVGLLTGMRRGKFAVSLDERQLGGNPLLDAWNGLVEGALPVTHAIRQVLLDDSVNTYHEAVQRLSTVHLAAPAYIIVSGTKSGEGALLTRNRKTLSHPLFLNSPSRYYLLETNYDWWKKLGEEGGPSVKDDRRAWGLYYMDTLGQKGFSASPAASLNSTMQRWPIMNGFTAQHVLMSAKTNLFQVYIVDNKTVVPPPQ